MADDQARQARLAAALRANLRRRKAAVPPTPEPAPASPPAPVGLPPADPASHDG